MELMAGPVLERPPGPRSGAAFRYAELAPKPPLPKPTTLERWRGRLPDETGIGLRIPDSCWIGDRGPLRPQRPAMDWLESAIEALRPAMIVLSTGASVTTGARDRERLRAYIAELPDLGGGRLVWRATGLWEPEALQSMATTLGVVGGIDGVDDPVPSAEVVYAALQAEGLRQSFSEAVLADVLQGLIQSPAREAFVAIESNQAIREAAALQALFEGTV